MELEQVSIQGAYIPVPLSCCKWIELCVFADASTMAIVAVAYLRALDFHGKWHVGFVMGKSKLALYPMHTVPHLELCAAVLAVELAEVIQSEMDIELQAVRFFTDSRIITKVIEQSLGATRFECFSVWKSLVRGMASLVHLAKSFSRDPNLTNVRGSISVTKHSPQNAVKQRCTSSRQCRRMCMKRS